VNVNDRDSKEAAIALARAYFDEYRSRIAGALGDAAPLDGLDRKWQELVRLAHGNNQRSSYLTLVASIKRDVREFSVRSLARTADAGPMPSGLSDLSPAEVTLVSTLDGLLPTAAASYRQGLLDLRAADRISYRGTASEFREVVREVLDHLAPDAEVTVRPGFRLEDGQRGPTMRQKVRFILTSRGRSKTQTATTEKAISVIEDLVGDVVRATYDRASLATHLETTRAEVLRIKRYVDTVLFDLLEVPEPAARRLTSR
jgi:hypothetical protein